jgi:hypothetical protein
MKTKKEKELMPLEMVRALMIEKGVDKALNLIKFWETVARNYNGEYYIPIRPASVRKRYGKTVRELIIGIRSSSSKNKNLLPETDVRDYMINCGILNCSNINKFWIEEATKYNNSNNEFFIPTSHIKKNYGKSLQKNS